MKKIFVNNKVYFTNITDADLLQKCFDFCGTGCLSYAISFNNDIKSIIQTTKVKGIQVNYLRKMNFNECFLPANVAELADSEKVLQKGLDLIEIL